MPVRYRSFELGRGEGSCVFCAHGKLFKGQRKSCGFGELVVDDCIFLVFFSRSRGMCGFNKKINIKFKAPIFKTPYIDYPADEINRWMSTGLHGHAYTAPPSPY